MTKSELDKKYYPQYLTLLSLVQDGLKLDINTELDANGDFIDKRVSFGYTIFVLERLHVEKVANEVQVVTDKALEDMYQLRKESVIHEQMGKDINGYCKMNEELAYFLGWDWYVTWDYSGRQRLYRHLAKKGKVYCFLESYNSCIYVTFLYKKVGGYTKFREPIKCRTHLELDNVKHILLNMNFKIDWYTYQFILQMFTEHYKNYSPYIPDKQEGEYKIKDLKQFKYL